MLRTRRQKQYMQRSAAPRVPSHSGGRDEGCPLVPEDIERYLEAYGREGYSEDTLKSYRRKLWRLYEDLPEDKRIRRGTLEHWHGQLLERGFAASTVNSYLSVVNTYLDFIGHREYQMIGQLEREEAPQPELTRTEYLRLLQAAKLMGKEKSYLLVKLFASTPLPVQELPKVTVEAVQEGEIPFSANRTEAVARIPKHLRQELLRYAQREGRLSGPIFITKGGIPINRTYVNLILRQLCPAAQVPEEKGNPRCLRRLYQSTLAAIESNVALLVEQAMERQLEMEQMSVGWEE